MMYMIDDRKKELIDKINEIRKEINLTPFAYEELDRYDYPQLLDFLERNMAMKNSFAPNAQNIQNQPKGKSFHLNPILIGIIAIVGISLALVFLPFSPIKNIRQTIEGGIFSSNPNSNSNSNQNLKYNFTVSFANYLLDGNPVFDVTNYGKDIASFAVNVDGAPTNFTNLNKLPILLGHQDAFSVSGNLCNSNEPHTIDVVVEGTKAGMPFSPSLCQGATALSSS